MNLNHSIHLNSISDEDIRLLTNEYNAKRTAGTRQYLKARGVPIYDLASIYRDLMVGSKSDPETTARSIGMSPELCMEVGQKLFAMYSGMTDPAQLEQYIKMIGLVFAFNVVLLIPDFPEAAQRGPAIIENLMRSVVTPNADTLKYILSK